MRVPNLVESKLSQIEPRTILRTDDFSSTLYHPAGTAAMGRVVDSQLRVLGVTGLRVADASVLPVPIASHYQACIFALGEQAASLILP